MKIVHNTLALIFTLALILTLLITSIEAVAYWTPGYYEKEYTKYGVAQDVSMEMEDLLYVTGEMMAYLRGNREDLHVETVVGGQQREFFNQREILHMEDVRNLFLAALVIRRVCLILMAAILVVLFLTKARIQQVLPRMFQAGTLLFTIITAGLALLFSTDFTKYFTLFHKIFFTNDLWLLDPRTDLLINIVPEPFFVDTALRIAIVFIGSVVILFVVSTLFRLADRRKCKRSEQ